MDEHQMIVLNKDFGELKRGTKGAILFDYGCRLYEVEFIVDGKSIIERIHENDFSLFNNIIH